MGGLGAGAGSDGGRLYDSTAQNRCLHKQQPPAPPPCLPAPPPPTIAAGKNQLFELGPGQQIKAMVKRIDNAAWAGLKNLAA